MASRKRSAVWDSFIVVAGKSGEFECLSCKCRVKAPHTNTSNLKIHLERHHPQLHAKVLKSDIEARLAPRKDENAFCPSASTSQQTLKEAFLRKGTLDNQFLIRSKAITKSLVQMICVDHLPLRIVEKPGFRNFITSLEPRYKLPDRKKNSHELIPEMYKSEKAKLMQKLTEANSFAVTTDLWTSASNDPYLSMTCHFIQASDFRFVNACLAIKNFPGLHTGQRLKEEIKTILTEWHVIKDNTDLFIISDNGANIRKAVSELEENGVLKARSCFAHTLQLVIEELHTFRGVTSIIAKGRAISGHFRRSTKAYEQLQMKQEQLGLPKHKLAQDCPTRWNSTLYMLDRLIEQRDAISAVLSSETAVANLTAYEWKTASDLKKLLSPLEEATRALCGDRYPTASMVIPVINGILHIMQKMQGGLNDLRTKLQQAIQMRWKDLEIDEIFSLATLVDPRFRAVPFHSNEAAREAVIQKCLVKMVALDESSDTHVGVTMVEAPTEQVEHEISLWQFLEDSKSKAMDSLAPTAYDRMKRELDMYLSEPLLQKHNSPFEWWGKNKSRFPHVAVLATVYLAIPATSVASERLFSKAGDVIRDNRSRLDPLRAEMLIFLGENVDPCAL